MPFPVPRDPPVTTAVLCRSDNASPPGRPVYRKHSSLVRLIHSRHDNCHVVSLLGRAAPLLRRSHQPLDQLLRRSGSMPENLLKEPSAPEFLAVDVLRFGEPVAIGHEQAAWTYLERPLVVGNPLQQTNHRAALL